MLPVKRVGIFHSGRGSTRRSLRAGIGGAAGERAKGTQGTGTSQCGTESTAAGGARRLSFGGYFRGVVVRFGRHGKAFRMMCE